MEVPVQGYSSNETIEALKEVAAKVLPQGYEYEFSGLSYEEIKAGSTTIYIFIFSHHVCISFPGSII